MPDNLEDNAVAFAILLVIIGVLGLGFMTKGLVGFFGAMISVGCVLFLIAML